MRAIVETVKRDGKAFKGTDGVWYSTRGAVCASLQAGQEVEFEDKVNGRWHNIINDTFTVVSAAQASPPSAAGSPPPLPWNQYNDKDFALGVQRKIGRQNALTNAVSAVGELGKRKADTYVATVLDLAQSFAMWTAGADATKVLDSRDVQSPAPTPPPAVESAPKQDPTPAPQAEYAPTAVAPAPPADFDDDLPF